MIAADYAKALFDISKNQTPDVRFLENARAALARRGHSKLLPRIYAEYQKLLLARERAAARARITHAQERTRQLLALYRALTR
jgi:F0F1-type ATP synthase delta subunit